MLCNEGLVCTGFSGLVIAPFRPRVKVKDLRLFDYWKATLQRPRRLLRPLSVGLVGWLDPGSRSFPFKAKNAMQRPIKARKSRSF